MLALLSPAKSLDYRRPLPDIAPTSPRLADEARAIAAAATRLSADDLARIMHISPALAELNAARFGDFTGLPERPALFAFNGDVYRGLEAYSLDEPAIVFAQDHLRILSGLYGLLRPLDAIRPYRLEMGTRWAPGGGDIYGHWGPRIAALLETDLADEGSGLIINLASKEYWAAVERHLAASTRVLAIDFMDNGAQGLRFNSFGAKRARGLMARHICEHRLSDPAALKGFDSEGYAFDPTGSDDARWRFVRNHPAR